MEGISGKAMTLTVAGEMSNKALTKAVAKMFTLESKDLIKTIESSASFATALEGLVLSGTADEIV